MKPMYRQVPLLQRGRGIHHYLPEATSKAHSIIETLSHACHSILSSCLLLPYISHGQQALQSGGVNPRSASNPPVRYLSCLGSEIVSVLLIPKKLCLSLRDAYKCRSYALLSARPSLCTLWQREGSLCLHLSPFKPSSTDLKRPTFRALLALRSTCTAAEAAGWTEDAAVQILFQEEASGTARTAAAGVIESLQKAEKSSYMIWYVIYPHIYIYTHYIYSNYI